MSKLKKKRRKRLQRKLNESYGYQRYRDKDVEVRNGSPCGHGLFAARQFTPGELVIEIGGQMHRQREYDGSRYVMELNKKWYLEPDVPGGFANHSCNPNCDLVQLTKYTLGLVAVCNIESGIELCFDYGWPAADWVPTCACGAPNCRGWVVAANQVRVMRKIVRRAARKKS